MALQVQVQELTDIPTISVAARFRYSEVRSAKIEYSAGKLLHVCVHASSKAPSQLDQSAPPESSRAHEPEADGWGAGCD